MTHVQMEMGAVSTKHKTAPSYVEFVIVVSMMMALTALATDAMLPALSQIGNDLRVTNPNERQLVISIIFLGSALGQLFFGPLSDKIGRKPAIYIGYSLFITGSLISVLAVNFPMMLGGRILQGIGISAPQAVAMALVRDRFEGRTMARVMSFAMTIFILVPMIAPTLGQGILTLTGWRGIFGSYILFALITVTWMALRIPETLAQNRRAPFSLARILNSIREILSIRMSLGYTLTAGLINGLFLGYLNSSQQIFQEQYELGDLFPIIFATISIALGLASFLNARLVMRYGMIKLVRWSLRIEFGLALIYLGISAACAGHPPLWSLITYLMLSFFCTGILFGNANSMAMQPLGHLAGVGAAVIGSISTMISMLLGTLIGQSYNGTVIPLLTGMTILPGLAILVLRWVETTSTPFKD